MTDNAPAIAKAKVALAEAAAALAELGVLVTYTIKAPSSGQPAEKQGAQRNLAAAVSAALREDHYR